MKMIRSVVRAINRSLFGADVIRPYRQTGVLSALGYQAAASKEIDKRWKPRIQEFF